MFARKTGELERVGIPGDQSSHEMDCSSAGRSALESVDIKLGAEQCQKGVCAITWKPGKPAAA